MPGKLGKKSKRTRTHKFIDPKKAARRNIRREIKKAEKKIAKLLKLCKEKKKRKNCEKKIRDKNGLQISSASLTRLQGMKEGSEKHEALKRHLSRLKQRQGEVDSISTKDTYLKKGVL